MSAAGSEPNRSEATRSEAGVDLPARGWSPVVTALLAAAGMLDFVDRLVFSTANDAIKHELHLSDATIGLLGGTAFALLYGIMIVPFALVGDRGYAARLAASGILLWSVATALMGRAHGIALLAVSRVGVGLGQAAFSPTTSALNAAYSTPEKRNTAFAICYGGSYVGYVLGLAGGGYLVEHIGWRATFALVGLLGLPISALMFAFIREPRTPHASPEAESWGALFRNRPLRDLLFYGVTSQVISYAVTLWGVSFYMRSFGLTSGQAGTWFGLGIGVSYVLGTLAGGPIADRARRRGGMPAAMRFAFWAYLLAQPFGLLQFATHSLTVSLAALVASSLIVSLSAAPIYASIPTVVPVHRRASASAFYALLANAVGIGVGPALFGWISDLLTPHFGGEALRMSLMVASVLSFWPAFHLWQMQRHLRGHQV